MQAANEGAARFPERAQSVGIRVSLPFEQEVNAFVAQAFEHRTFFTRLHQFVLASDAFIVAPGGIGTVLETMMIWQLLQVRHLQDTHLILVGKMWSGLVNWAKTQLLTTHPPLANPEDMEIPRCVDTADEAIALIREYKGDGEYLSVHHPEAADAKDDAPDATVLALLAGAGGGIGEILFA